MKKAIVCGGGGFIGNHLVKRLKNDGFWVRAVDLKFPEYDNTDADDFIQGDLRDLNFCHRAFDMKFDEVYQLAADMGGAGFIFTGENDADIMHNSATINLNVLETCRQRNINNIFYSSSACMYPEHNQMDPDNPLCSEESAYPANPDSEYGWEKLFSERLCMSFEKNYGIRARMCRFHNVFGPESTWTGGKEKSPAALCRKVAMSEDETVEIWGPGTQTRSFLYIDEAIEGIHRIMESDYNQPLNLGSERMIAINDLAHLIASVNTNKKLTINNVPGPVGVNGRNSHNKLIQETIGWAPQDNLEYGLQQTYQWILQQIEKQET